ncbi:acyltransferase family protein [Patescibacteria group bacterium]|nr:acyltransferase family protein [Patescibacteria group bacterium]
MHSFKKNDKGRLVWLDISRILAIFLMVLLHVSAGYVPLWFEQSLFGWTASNLFASLSRICVPLLIMVSGALLLPKMEKVGLWQFYQKRLARLVRPWLFWSVVFGVINVLTGNEATSIKRLIVGTVWTGFWLLPVLMGMYVAAPFFAKGEKYFGKLLVWVYLLVGTWVLISGIHLPLYFEYFVYFVGGKILADFKTSSLAKWIGFGVWLIGLFFTTYLTFNLSLANRGFVSTYYGFNSWTVFVMSVGSFLFLAQLKNFFENRLSATVKKVVANLSLISFQIYFAHLLFFRISFSFTTLPAMIFIPVYTLLIFGGSWWIVWLMGKNNFLAKLSGAEERT